MDHAEARELLEVAAAEPAGLERLMAGDTAEAAALAGHLAGCPECADEMTRLRRAAAVVGAIVRSTPSPELRERTLALVAAVGRDRSAAGAGAPSPEPIAIPTAGSSEPERPEARRPRRSPMAPRRVAGLAAALLIAAGATGLAVWTVREGDVAARQAEVERGAQAVSALERVATWMLRVTSAGDARRVELAAAAGGTASGSLVFSPATRELVVVANGLARPLEGRELRCWLEVDGVREPVGRMFFADDLAFWAGPVEAVATLPQGTVFGVTLVEAGGGSLDGPSVLGGRL